MSIESIRGRIKQIVDSEIARCADDVTGRTYKLAISNVWNQIECLPMGDAAIRKDAVTVEGDLVSGLSSPAVSSTLNEVMLEINAIRKVEIGRAHV